jgi:cytochrome c-type biogenesis protein CcmE
MEGKMETERRTRRPLPTWAKGLLALAILVATGAAAFYSVDEQVDYISVETAVSGDYDAGERIQVHGVVLNWTREDIELVEGDYTLRIDLGGVIIPDTFAEDKGATITGTLVEVDGALMLRAEIIQMGCPSKYEPAEA